MAIINYDSDSDNDSMLGEKLIIAIGAIIVVIVLFFRFGLPALQTSYGNGATAHVSDKIEVGINK